MGCSSPENRLLTQAKVKKKDLTERLLAGTMKPAMFASALLCMSRERQNKVMAQLVAGAALKGHLRRTYVAHLEAMASVLSPSGMSLAANAYQVREFRLCGSCMTLAPVCIMSLGLERLGAMDLWRSGQCWQLLWEQASLRCARRPCLWGAFSF